MYELFRQAISRDKYYWMSPKDCGGPEGAPILTNGKDVWGFLDYRVTSPQEKLAETGACAFVYGGEIG